MSTLPKSEIRSRNNYLYFQFGLGEGQGGAEYLGVNGGVGDYNVVYKGKPICQTHYLTRRKLHHFLYRLKSLHAQVKILFRGLLSLLRVHWKEPRVGDTIWFLGGEDLEKQVY